ncbi:hypothetical protein NEAUS03_1193 [Nematocida ausubeli]|nr:hypothetical protein NEAUS03_1193 [Nematocida ausubeli]
MAGERSVSGDRKDHLKRKGLPGPDSSTKRNKERQPAQSAEIAQKTQRPAKRAKSERNAAGGSKLKNANKKEDPSVRSAFIGKSVTVKYLGREIKGVCEMIDTYLNVVVSNEHNTYIVKGCVVEEIEENK